jgi:hypothetical protein
MRRSVGRVLVTSNPKQGGYANVQAAMMSTLVPPLPQLIGVKGHLNLAHMFLRQVLRPGDTVIDATAGKGHDSSFLARIILTPDSGSLVSMDVQEQALAKTRETLVLSMAPLYSVKQIESMMRDRVRLVLQNHRSFPTDIPDESVAAIVYNLGYLPGSDKSITTCPADTIASIEAATRLVKTHGLISILAYRGHEGGVEETAAVEKFATSLKPFDWSVYSHYPLNRPTSPVVFTLFKNA